MFDWSDIFNIVFVAGTGALSLFFIISTVAVAAKGKRRCNAFDVILRILSSLCFIVSVALVLCAVLSMLGGELRIMFESPKVEGDPLVPVLVFFGNNITLPLARLFLLFSTETGMVIGFALAVLLFVCSLMALIVDCLVANKKEKKQPSASAVKTAERIKREKELERIKKIGESAVQKTAKAAETEKTEKKDTATDADNDTDWRAEQKTESANAAEFVGISDNTENEFDTFGLYEPIGDDVKNDTIDAASEERPLATEETKEPAVDAFAHYEAESEVAEADENILPDDEMQEVTASDEAIEETSQDEEVEDAYSESFASDEALAEEEPEEEASAQDETVEPTATESYEDNAASVQDEDASEKTSAQGETATEYGDIEPDRGIYIPEIRTIVKDDEPVVAAPKKETATKPSSAKKTAAKSGGTTKGGARGGAAKPETKSAGGTKKPAATRAAESGAAKKRAASETAAAKNSDGTATPEKKLPVTRRYVILDRRNAVNMFGEYLRERNKADKEKLQSSINTIIIE